MGRLADAYLAARRAATEESGAGRADGASLEEELAPLLARARAAHPALQIEDAAFAARLGSCGARLDPGTHVEDLYLAAAALGGDASAVETLRRIHRPILAGYLRRVDSAPAFVEEVEQRLWDAALVGGAGAPAKLASYAGKGPLAGWVGVTALRIALMMRRRDDVEARAHQAATVEAHILADDPEMALIKGTLREKFHAAISRGLAALGDRERMVFSLHLVDELTVEEIGKMYGVNHSTISRWLAKARGSVIAEANRVLRDEMKLAGEELESLAGLLVSRLDLSVSWLLRRVS